MRTVYIETDSDGQILNNNLYAAYEGFSKKAYDIKFYHLLAPTTNKDDIVCGRISAVKEAWRYLGVAAPAQLDYPESLTPFLKRTMRVSTVQEVHHEMWAAVYAREAKSLFIKPKVIGKLFTGHVINTENTKSFEKSLVGDMSAEVWVSDPLHFISEYRCFIHNNEIVGAKNYYGDFREHPDWMTVQLAVERFAPYAPVAYSLDMGLSDLGTVLVEVNDSFALGHYGLDSFKYANMMEARWDEVCGNT